MAVSRQEVRRLAELAGLTLSPDEEAEMVRHLETMAEVTAGLGRGLEPGDNDRDVDRDDGFDGTDGGPGDGHPDASGEPGPPGPDPLARPPEAWAAEWRDGHFIVPRAEVPGPATSQPGEGSGG